MLLVPTGFDLCNVALIVVDFSLKDSLVNDFQEQTEPVCVQKEEESEEYCTHGDVRLQFGVLGSILEALNDLYHKQRQAVKAAIEPTCHRE